MRELFENMDIKARMTAIEVACSLAIVHSMKKSAEKALSDADDLRETAELTNTPEDIQVAELAAFAAYELKDQHEAGLRRANDPVRLARYKKSGGPVIEYVLEGTSRDNKLDIGKIADKLKQAFSWSPEVVVEVKGDLLLCHVSKKQLNPVITWLASNTNIEPEIIEKGSAGIPFLMTEEATREFLETAAKYFLDASQAYADSK